MVSFYIVSRGNWLLKVANIKKKKNPMVLQFMFLKLPDGVQSFVFCPQIEME